VRVEASESGERWTELGVPAQSSGSLSQAEGGPSWGSLPRALVLRVGKRWTELGVPAQSSGSPSRQKVD